MSNYGTGVLNVNAMVNMQSIVEMSAYRIKSIFGAQGTREKSLALFVLVSKVWWYNDYRKHSSFVIRQNPNPRQQFRVMSHFYCALLSASV